MFSSRICLAGILTAMAPTVQQAGGSYYKTLGCQREDPPLSGKDSGACLESLPFHCYDTACSGLEVALWLPGEIVS
jgi:hypothetical protein